MAGNNLSPRQKMIGMMYLVLTAMLALNVSKEVLDAFQKINNGIVKTTQNFSSKNDDIYNDLFQQLKQMKQRLVLGEIKLLVLNQKQIKLSMIFNVKVRHGYAFRGNIRW